jgi:hypothetical protein
MYNASCNGARVDKRLYGLINTRIRCESGENYELVTKPDKLTAERFGLIEGQSQTLGFGNYSTSIRLARLANGKTSGDEQYVVVKKINGNPAAAKKEFDVHVALASHATLGG